MKTITEYVPTASAPSSARRPPSTRVATNPARIAIRISGTNALDSRIAARLASR
jgi:hypothetical protein